MTKWQEVKLGDENITTLIGDGLHGTPIYSEKGKYAFINGNNLFAGHIVIKSDTKMVEESEYLKYKKNLNNKTLFVSINGTLGNIAEYNNEKIILGKSTCYLNIFSNVDKLFIKYILLSSTFQNYLQNNATGTTIKNVSLKQIREYSFLLPPLATQKQIAGVLSTLDDKIELNNKINQNLEQQAQALFKSWFIDFTPFGGTMPTDWKVGIVDEIIELYDSKRIPLSSNQREKMAKIYPYYGATSLMDYVDEYIFDGKYLLLGEDGTVIDNQGFPVLQYVWGKFWVNNHAHIMSGKNGFNVESLYLFFKQKNIKSIVTGAVQPKVNQANLKALSVTIPSKDIMNRFNKTIQPLFDLIRNKHEENIRLAQLRDTLLPKLMSGEIDVSQVDISSPLRHYEE